MDHGRRDMGVGVPLRDRALFAALTKPPKSVLALRVTIPHASLRG
jgi:hypothetical protein